MSACQTCGGFGNRHDPIAHDAEPFWPWDEGYGEPCCDRIYICKGEMECPIHGGFDVCCNRPDLHRPLALVPSTLRRCIVHDTSFTTICSGCRADDIAAKEDTA